MRQQGASAGATPPPEAHEGPLGFGGPGDKANSILVRGPRGLNRSCSQQRLPPAPLVEKATPRRSQCQTHRQRSQCRRDTRSDRDYLLERCSELVVVPRDVVNAGCRDEAADAGVGSVVIVEVEPGGVRRCAGGV